MDRVSHRFQRFRCLLRLNETTMNTTNKTPKSKARQKTPDKPKGSKTRRNSSANPHPTRPPSNPASARSKENPPSKERNGIEVKASASIKKTLPQFIPRSSPRFLRRNNHTPRSTAAITIHMQPHPNHNRSCQVHQDKRPEVNLGNTSANRVINPNVRKIIPLKSQTKRSNRTRKPNHRSNWEGGAEEGEFLGGLFFDLTTNNTNFQESLH